MFNLSSLITQISSKGNVMFNSEFFKKAFKNTTASADSNGSKYESCSLEQKRQEAISYLGEKWLLHPNNHVNKK